MNCREQLSNGWRDSIQSTSEQSRYWKTLRALQICRHDTVALIVSRSPAFNLFLFVSYTDVFIWSFVEIVFSRNIPGKWVPFSCHVGKYSCSDSANMFGIHFTIIWLVVVETGQMVCISSLEWTSPMCCYWFFLSVLLKNFIHWPSSFPW